MNYMEVEELALLVLGIDEKDADKVDLDDLMYEKLDVTMEQFHGVADALMAFTIPAQVGISGKLFKGFATDTYFVAKMEVEASQ